MWEIRFVLMNMILIGKFWMSFNVTNAPDEDEDNINIPSTEAPTLKSHKT